jgi:hypothetical protein
MVVFILVSDPPVLYLAPDVLRVFLSVCYILMLLRLA